MKRLSFAHLNPFGRGKAAEGEDDAETGKDQKDGETEDETGEDDAKAGGGEDDADADAEGKGGKGNAAATDPRLQERRRCAAIFAAPAAAGRVEMACRLAFETDLPAAQAVALLKAAPEGSQTRGNPLALNAMNDFPNPKVGPASGDGGRSEDQKAGEAVLASMASLGLRRRNKETK